MKKSAILFLTTTTLSLGCLSSGCVFTSSTKPNNLEDVLIIEHVKFITKSRILDTSTTAELNFDATKDQVDDEFCAKKTSTLHRGDVKYLSKKHNDKHIAELDFDCTVGKPILSNSFEIVDEDFANSEHGLHICPHCFQKDNEK